MNSFAIIALALLTTPANTPEPAGIALHNNVHDTKINASDAASNWGSWHPVPGVSGVYARASSKDTEAPYWWRWEFKNQTQHEITFRYKVDTDPEKLRSKYWDGRVTLAGGEKSSTMGSSYRAYSNVLYVLGKKID